MTLVTNGRLITRDPEGQGYYEHGAVAYEGTKIVEIGEEAALRTKYPQAEIIDAKGGVIMPALINAHTHIYSALARGLSIVGNNPTNFYEVLDGTWWAIDRHLMMDGTRASATALYIDSIKQGVTTIFDHHASYGEIPGTLHTIAEESKRLGLRSCLCYEVSDRDGEEKCLQAIQENADFITYWLPILSQSDYNRIAFPCADYARLVPLQCQPQPDTLIRVYMLSEGLDEAVMMEPQTLMPAPIRTGLTVVEWGGTDASYMKR